MENDFWINNPKILLNKNKILEIWPYSELSYNNKLNAVTRFIIIISLFGYMTLNNYIVLLLGIIIILSIIFIYNYYEKENFENLSDNYNDDDKYHNEKNPLYNMLVGDYPVKKELTVEYNENMEKNINDKTKKFILDNNNDNSEIGEIFKSLSDNLNFESSMRQFYINPNTTNPNNQDSFVKYCYNNLYSEKPLLIH